jgi:cold shock CspA family protein
MQPTTQYGTLRKWFAPRSYGFIRADDVKTAGEDIFLHISGFENHVPLRRK